METSICYVYPISAEVLCLLLGEHTEIGKFVESGAKYAPAVAHLCSAETKSETERYFVHSAVKGWE